jgi:RNA polymerase sigma factor (sigma-70 family)
VNERQPEEVEHQELVENTQEFLRAVMTEQMPDALLTAAWDEFYRVYDVLVRRFAVARGVRGADVDDCVQDVWSEIAKRLVGFQITSEAGLRSWLFALVRSRATDMFRRRARRPLAFLGDSIQDGFEPAGREPDPSTRYDDAWLEAVLQTMVLKLEAEVSELNFEIFRLRSLEGVGVSEAAEMVGVTPNQIRYRHHRTMKKLKAIVALYVGRDFHGIDIGGDDL